MSDDQLSFLSVEDQHKFAQLFQQAANNSSSISPNSARNILLKSNLGPHHLARIWELSDINKTGDLLFPEFALALHLCNVVLRGAELPYQLDPRIKEEVTKLVDKINFSVPEETSVQQQQQQQPPSAPHQLNRSVTSDILETQTLQQQQSILLQSQPNGYGFQTQSQTFNAENAPPLPSLNYQATGILPQQQQQQQAQSVLSQNPFSNGAFQQQPSLQPTPTSQQPFQSQNALDGGLNRQQTGFPASIASQQSSNFFNEPSAQPQQQPLQPTSSFPSSSTTSAPANTLNPQATGLVPLQSYQTGVFNSTPSNQQQQQSSGFNTLTSQQTGGLVPLNNQQTGGLVPLKNQQTSSGVIPQPTATGLTQQPTGLIPLKTQSTSGLNPQATGLVPINSQQTGSGSQSTGPLKNQQQSGIVSLNPQKTGPTTAAIQPQTTGLIPLPRQQTGYQQSQATGSLPLQQPLAPGSTGGAGLLSNQTRQQQTTPLPPLQSQKTGFGNFEPLRQQKTGVGHNSFFLSNLIQQQEQASQQHFDTVSIYANESISPQEKQLFNKIFDNYDINKKGLMKADVSAEIFRKSGLNREDLERVWDLITRPNQTSLDKESFQLGMWLVYKRLNGFPIPEYLPDSLKPSSLKILDDVKNTLKSNNNVKTVKKSSHSRIDGSRFKNNDDEFVLSANRNRRRRTTDFSNDGSSGSGSPVKNENGENLGVTSTIKSEKYTIEELKKKIWEKKILLEALQDDKETINENSKTEEVEDLKTIEMLKEEIKNLPSSNHVDKNETVVLKTRFDELSKRVPVLINNISSTDNQIKDLKLELYKIKNPSVILGSGPNGEILDSDRKKFKSKQLLAVKMAKLTGKPLDPEIETFNHQEEKLHDEVIKIQKDNEQNQKVIKDIENSINELSLSIKSSLNNSRSGIDEENYKKWELGVGVQSEVKELIKSFKVEDISSRFATSLAIKEPIPVKSPVASSPSIQQRSVSSPSNRGTPEERKAFIREQARKRMEEKMAKFGIRHSSGSRVTSPLPSSTVPKPVETPVPERPADSLIQETHKEESSSDDDDEEEFQRMEEIRRLKRLERDARLAESGNL